MILKKMLKSTKQNKTKKTTLNNRITKTRKTKLSLQLFLNLQYVAFVSSFCMEYYY